MTGRIFTDIIPLMSQTTPDDPLFAAEDAFTVNSPFDDPMHPVYVTVYWRIHNGWRGSVKRTMGFEMPLLLTCGENYDALVLEPSDSIRLWL